MLVKKKVIQIVEDLKVGGMENVVFNISRGLSKLEYEIEVWCLAGGGLVADELATYGVCVRVLGISSYHRPTSMLALVRLLRTSRPDIVHTRGYFAGTAGRIAAICAGVPSIFHHVHSTYWGYGRRKLIIEWILALLTRKIVCISQAVESFVLNVEKIPRARVLVIYNGIEKPVPGIGCLSRLRESLGLAGQCAIVTTVASLTPHKGHKYLLLAAAEVLKRFGRCQFLIVGDGPERNDLEDLAGRLGISQHVIFAGIRRDIPQLIALTDIFVLPSCIREGLGIAVIEAMAQGKAAIGSSLGGIVEVISDSVSGVLVPPEDHVSLSAAIERLLRDPEERGRMGCQGYALFLEKFTASMMISQIEDLYRD